MVMTVKGEINFIIDNNEANAADLGLKIRVFAAAHFCFTKASFSWFFSHYFIKTSFVD